MLKTICSCCVVPQLSTRWQQSNNFVKSWKEAYTCVFCCPAYLGQQTSTVTRVIFWNRLDDLSNSVFTYIHFELVWFGRFPLLLETPLVFDFLKSVFIWQFKGNCPSLYQLILFKFIFSPCPHLQAVPLRSPSQWAMQESCTRSGWNWETAASAALSSM